MNTNRRNLLKMSAALGTIATATGHPERLAAIREFGRLTDEVSANFPESVLGNPAQMAHAMEGSISDILIDFGDALAPEDWAAWRKAEIEMFRAYPELKVYGPWSLFSDETFNFIMTAFMAGVQRGAVYESVRQELTTSKTVCWDCFGSGVAWSTQKLEEDEWKDCPTCGGAGTATPPKDLPYRQWPRADRQPD